MDPRPFQCYASPQVADVLFGQVLLPYVRQRNPEARARLQEELVELSALGRRLRNALLREAVRESLSE